MEQVTGHGYIRNHDPIGTTLYVIDICILPSYRKLGLGKFLMLVYPVKVVINNPEDEESLNNAY